MADRKAATETLLDYIERFTPGDTRNREIYEKRLKAMSNKDFEAFIEDLESGEETLALFVANLDEAGVSIENNFEIAKALGHEFFQPLRLTDDETGQQYTTPIPHLVIDLPLRRQAQMLAKKSSIPEHNRSVDERTDQPTDASKSGRLSYPEVQVNAAKGLDNMVIELIKYRGGDTRAHNAMNRQIMETGEASMDSITAQEPSDVKSTETLAILLKGMHLDNNLTT